MPTTDTTTHNTDADLDKPLWGAASFAPEINRSERAVRNLIKTKKLDVTKVGALYTSTRRRLLKSLGVDQR